MVDSMMAIYNPVRHSGAARRAEPKVRNCAPGNLEKISARLRVRADARPGMTNWCIACTHPPAASIRLLRQPEALDHLALGLDLLGDEFPVVLRALVVRHHVVLGQVLQQRRLLDRLLEGVVQLGDHLRIHPLWPGDAEWRIEHEGVAE